ncbi:phospholipase/carboxylesterase [Rhodococcus wratislaviensis]|uniref:Phospholipase/carboxylesterase n=1 Tax=Rhodococcus wratislaviensis TaxID=44752 RepID=A0A402CL77_RHOWR|nr:phospholipase [Rhodococcus wratislaviensis]GCE44367.1 phospholipase/carboxylesterase [Rhodococcus wratislaviensis]
MMTSNPHLNTEPLQHGVDDLVHAPLVIYAVHGRGQQPQFMAEVADRIGMNGAGYVLPRAESASWYPESFLKPLAENEPSLSHALDAVDTHLSRLAAQGVPPERTVLLGFSQGACLLAEYLLRSGRCYAGAALLTGGYLGPDEKSWATGPGAFDGMPVLLTTSARDTWVPLARVHATTESFVELGASVRLHVDDDPEHHINDDVVSHIRRLFDTITTRR